MIEFLDMTLPSYCEHQNPWSHTLGEGEAVCLMGASGCGKSTLLEIVAGLRPWCGGVCRVDGVELSTQPLEHRFVGLVPQDTVLFPHLSVEKQIDFPLKARGWERSQRSQRIKYLLDLFEIESLKRHYPHELSGGQAKRVALARALSFRPALLCLDELSAGLDRELTARILKALRTALREEKFALLAVTHREEEVALLGAELVRW